jgi:N-acetylmuramoyl-L-alanine amidase
MKLSPTYYWALAVLVGSTSNGRCDPAQSSTPQIAWVSLSNWAKDNGYKMTWSKPDEDVTLGKGATTLHFTADSELAQINGIHVWLCDPITMRDGHLCLSTLDVKATLQPLLSPATNHSGHPVKTICLDPGHGGKDTGGAVGEFMEKQFTLLLARELERQLSAAGFTIILTRDKDEYVELEERPALANRRQADLFISLHFNVAPQGDAKGVEVYCLTPARASSTNGRGKPANTEALPGNQQDQQNILLACRLQESLVKNLAADDRGLRRARFEVLRTPSMPAVLIEGGFLTDKGERGKIADPKYRALMATAIVQGVLAYKHNVE